MNGVSFLGDMLQTITDRSRRFLSLSGRGEGAAGSIEAVCDTLLSSHGEASGMALAKNILDRWSRFDERQCRDFMVMLLERFGPDTARLEAAIDGYRTEKTPQALLELHTAAEPRRPELIRRLNLAPNGIGTLVRMRDDLLAMKSATLGLDAVDADFIASVRLLVQLWLSRAAPDWSTPADILEKIIRSSSTSP